MDDSTNIPAVSLEDTALITLDRIPVPGACRVVSISAPALVRKRLLALGFIPSTRIEAVRAAPLGDPVEYRIKGYNISLRKEDARLITVTTGAA